MIKKTSLEAYSRPRQNGINAITIRENDCLMEAILTSGESEIMVAVQSGRAIRFPENTVRDMGRTATGVRAVTLDNEQDQVIGMIAIEPESDRTVLVVSEHGFGKKSEIDDYRITNRGGKGVKTISITEKTGTLIAIKAVADSDDLMIITKSGLTIRMHAADIRVAGRATQGVKLINIKEQDAIASVTLVPTSDEEDLPSDTTDGPADILETDATEAETINQQQE